MEPNGAEKVIKIFSFDFLIRSEKCLLLLIKRNRIKKVHSKMRNNLACVAGDHQFLVGGNDNNLD